jgi:hypothetical protein
LILVFIARVAAAAELYTATVPVMVRALMIAEASAAVTIAFNHRFCAASGKLTHDE